MTRARPFQVDLGGIIDLLSRHLYSSPRVYLRELLQNGRDAVAARRLADPDAPAGHIAVTAADGVVTVTDNGIGLTAAEATDLLATVGRSSKRDEVLGLRRSDFLGQFGIGLLSCFLVGEDIVIRSRSATGAPAIEWIGSANGTFVVREIDDDLPIGTTVQITARRDDAALAEPATVEGLLRHFGEFLPGEITFAGRRINRPAPFLAGTPDEIADYGAEIVGAPPLDAIPLVAPGTGTRGVAYVLPFSPPPGARQAHRVYLGGMLLGERVTDLLPSWAFFVRCVVDTDQLSPTASRETLMDNEALADTRDALGRALRQWIVTLAMTDPVRFQQFVSVHQFALKSMALHDAELAATLLPHITVETSAGITTFGDLLARHQEIRYAETVDEFRQVAPVAPADAPIVNAGYTLDAELLRRVPQVFRDAVTRRIRVHDVIAALDPVDLASRRDAVALEQRCRAALATVGVQVVTRVFQPADLPALYVADPAVLRRADRRGVREESAALWASVLNEVDDILADQGPTEPQWCLNWASPLVRGLTRLDDQVVFDRSVRLLYVQSLLSGHQPLTTQHRQMLTEAMGDLIALSVISSTTDPEGLTT